LNATGRPILFSLCNWGEENVLQWGASLGQMYRFQMDHLPFWEWPNWAAVRICFLFVCFLIIFALSLRGCSHHQGEGFGQGTLNIIEYMATLNPSKHSGPYGENASSIFLFLFLSSFHFPLALSGYMDPDFLETLFPTLDFTQSRTEFSFWTLWSAPLLIATDVRNMSAQLASIITNQEVIAIDQDPLGIAGPSEAWVNFNA
jgi:alpha-galactosidase